MSARTSDPYVADTSTKGREMLDYSKKRNREQFVADWYDTVERWQRGLRKRRH